jgi:hypothetical protein
MEKIQQKRRSFYCDRLLTSCYNTTPLTSKADSFLQGKSGEVLPDLVKAVWG